MASNFSGDVSPPGYTIIRDAYQRSIQQANSFPDLFNNVAGQSRVQQQRDSQPAVPEVQSSPSQQPGTTMLPMPPGAAPQAGLIAQQIILSKLAGNQQFGPSNRPMNLAQSQMWQTQPGYMRQFDPVANQQVRSKPAMQPGSPEFQNAAAYIISMLSGKT